MKNKLILIVVCLVECLLIFVIVRSFPKRFAILPIREDMMLFGSVNSRLRFYYAPKPNSLQEENLSAIHMDGKAVHKINGDGLEAERDYLIPKPTRLFRIISMGDSFTQGAYVNTEDNYASVLERMLNASVQCSTHDMFEVINLGVEGYDMNYSVQRFKEKAFKYQADAIIFYVANNDFLFDNEEYHNFIERENPQKSQANEIQIRKALGDSEAEFNVIVDKFYSLYSENSILLKQLAYFREFLDMSDKPLLIFSLVNIPQKVQQVIREAIGRRNNTYYYPELKTNYSSLKDGHPSIQGHKEFAEFIYEKLMKSHMLPCVSQE